MPTVSSLARPRSLVLALSAVLLALTAVLAPATLAGPVVAPAAGVEVVGDDEADAYVGRGGLILPPSVGEVTRRTVAECPDCRWRLTTPCVDTDLGNAFDGRQPCLSVTRPCPGGRLMRTWFDPGTGSWRDLGSVCLRETVHTVESLGQDLRSIVRQELPRADLGVLPASGVVTQLPTYFASGQADGAVRFQRDVAGARVDLVARPRWQWDFGDGASMTTDVAGELVPGGPVAHVYRRPGLWEVRCRVLWEAEFTVDGLGPFPVTGTIRQAARGVVAVGEGRALLTP